MASALPEPRRRAPTRDARRLPGVPHLRVVPPWRAPRESQRGLPADLLEAWERALDVAQSALNSAAALRVYDRPGLDRCRRRLSEEREWLVRLRERSAIESAERPHLRSVTSPMRARASSVRLEVSERRLR